MAYTTIDDPSAHFQIDLYTGSGSAKTFDGNSDLQPDMVWIKARSTAEKTRIADSSRGVGDGTDETKWMVVQDAGTEESSTEFTSINSDGFTLNSSDAKLNSGSHTYVAWAWKANGGTRVTFTESGDNPAGGHSANTTAGFSVVDYTGTGDNGTVAHGLGAAPDVIILKCRSDAHDWQVGHDSIASDAWTDYLNPNTTGAAADYYGHWNDTAPTSTVFSLGDNTGLNGDGRTFIAYCFTPIQGYSKFGTYTGNGNADGPFVYTGFKPAWVLIKKSSSTGSWTILDIKRGASYGENDHTLKTNGADAEYTSENFLGFMSNGFKFEGTNGDVNADAAKYVYMAFAHQPFVTSGGVPCTAR